MELEGVLRAFFPDQNPLAIEPFGSGHINRTYRVETEDQMLVLQKLNTDVFQNAEGLMTNMVRVCEHLHKKGEPTLTLVPTQSGQAYHTDDQGGVWRLSPFLPGTRTIDQPENPTQAYQAGLAFGRFAQAVADLPEPRLVETIPDFHHTPRRLQRLLEVATKDPVGRVQECQTELTYAQQRQKEAGRLLDLGLPERITHNDTKINNVLLRQESDEAVCVIDLDTVMPGLVLYDFGDLVRTTTCLAPEDCQDLGRMEPDLNLFEALTRGYLEGVRGALTEAELGELAFSGWLITFEVGIRFLTDHLEGDVYFRCHHPGHNLQRARAQLALARALERRRDHLEKVIKSLRESV